MKRGYGFILLLWAFALSAADWRATQPFYFLGESPDGKTADCPLVAAAYGGPDGVTKNLVFGIGHAAEGFMRPGAAVAAGTLDGLFPPTSWTPPDSPCGNLRDTCYLIDRYTVKDDFFIATLCRNVEFGVTEAAPNQKVGDAVTWYSRARKEWVESRVVGWEPTGALILSGTLALTGTDTNTGDSGSPVFTDGVHYREGGPGGKYVGAVKEFVTTWNGFAIKGAKVAVYGNPRLDDYVLPPGWKPGDVTKIGTDPVTHEVPRVAGTLISAGGFLFTVAEPDSSLWRLTPSDLKWDKVTALPPIIETVSP